jgi:hypothetical protein
MPIHSAVGTLIRKTSLLRTVPTACGQAADKLTPFATLSHDRSSELAHERDFHHARCSERSYLFTMSDIIQISAGTHTSRYLHIAYVCTGPTSRTLTKPDGLAQARNCHFTDEQGSIT